MPGARTSSTSSSPQTQHGEKRKAEDASGRASVGGSAGTHARSKRNRYISIACNECKRRKIKCNGQTPCQRCGNLSLECIYAPNCCANSVKDSEEFLRMREHIDSLQNQVNDLYAGLKELQVQRQPEPFPLPPPSSEGLLLDDPGTGLSISADRTLPPLPAPKPRRESQRSFAPYHGPTSSTYGFDVARSTLKNMGIMQVTADEGVISQDRSANISPVPREKPVPHTIKDPLWLIDRDEAQRLCTVYEEEIGNMYPQLDVNKLTKHADMLYIFIGAAVRAGFGRPHLPGADAIEDEDTVLLKLVLATSLMLEGNGKSELGERFYDSARFAVNLKIVGELDLMAVHLMVMTATYHFHKDEEDKAWRFIGIAARMCTGMGLHRKDSLLKNFTNEAEYIGAIRTFWVVYALDRRWSFGTGMPFALQDGDIDPYLPEPDDSVPYLKHITRYNKIAAKVWYNNVAFEDGQGHKHDEIDYLDYQILQWYRQLPESMQFNSKDLASEMSAGHGTKRLRFIMHLRKNQARLSLYRPIFHSATSIMENRQYAQTAVDIAKDTIQSIAGVNQCSDLYRTRQIVYNYFLVQALAVVFLAVSHAPAEFCRQTRDEFVAAIELVRTFNTKSHIAKRLWRTIKGLKDMGDKLGMMARVQNDGGDTADQEQAHANAAMAMTGLSGQPADGMNGFSNTFGQGLGVSPDDAVQMGDELSTLFEMAGGYGLGGVAGTPTSGMGDGYDGYVMSNHDPQMNANDAVLTTFGDQQEFARLLGDLF